MAASNANYKMAAQAITNCGLTPTEVVREYGVTYEDCQRMVQEGLVPFLGRPDSYQYIISIKSRGYPWPSHHAGVISRAKEDCDAGRSNLTYAYSLETIVMYSFPNTVKLFRKPWFFGGGDRDE